MGVVVKMRPCPGGMDLERWTTLMDDLDAISHALRTARTEARRGGDASCTELAASLYWLAETACAAADSLGGGDAA